MKTLLLSLLTLSLAHSIVAEARSVAPLMKGRFQYQVEYKAEENGPLMGMEASCNGQAYVRIDATSAALTFQKFQCEGTTVEAEDVLLDIRKGELFLTGSERKVGQVQADGSLNFQLVEWQDVTLADGLDFDAADCSKERFVSRTYQLIRQVTYRLAKGAAPGSYSLSRTEDRGVAGPQWKRSQTCPGKKFQAASRRNVTTHLSGSLIP